MSALDRQPSLNRSKAIPESMEPWTIGTLLDWTARFLAEKNATEYPRLDAEVLLAHVLGCRRIDLYTRYAESAAEDVRQRYRDLIRKRIEGCPVAYLVGFKEFYSLRLEVTPAVLIPRPESEFVVMECLGLARDLPAPRIVDIGTGSGNIAVTVAQQHAGAQVTAIDLSSEALAVAQRNAERHGVAGRIRFVHGDLLDPIPPGEQFDFVLSNPPYIAREDLPRLPVGVRDYEPHLALDGGVAGYTIIERLIPQAADRLLPGGYLIMEIGAPQEETVRQRIADHGGFELAPTTHDYSGHPRVVRARKRA